MKKTGLSSMFKIPPCPNKKILRSERVYFLVLFALGMLAPNGDRVLLYGFTAFTFFSLFFVSLFLWPIYRFLINKRRPRVIWLIVTLVLVLPHLVNFVDFALGPKGRYLSDQKVLTIAENQIKSLEDYYPKEENKEDDCFYSLISRRLYIAHSGRFWYEKSKDLLTPLAMSLGKGIGVTIIYERTEKGKGCEIYFYDIKISRVFLIVSSATRTTKEIECSGCSYRRAKYSNEI